MTTLPDQPSPPELAERAPDPGSPRAARIASWAAVVLLAAVAVLQQIGSSAPKAPRVSPAPAPTAAPTPVPTQAQKAEPRRLADAEASFEIAAKVVTRLGEYFRRTAGRTGPGFAEVEELARGPDGRVAPDDQLRLAVVEAEMKDAGAAIERLDALLESLPPDDPLRPDARALRAMYEDSAAAPLDDATAKRLTEHHGWFGRIAGVFGKPDADPDRERVLGGGGTIIAAALLLGLAAAAAFVIGCVILIYLFVKVGGGDWPRHFTPPAPGGSVGVEMFALFMAGFLAIKALADAVATIAGPTRPTAPLLFLLIAQWALAGLIFWPTFRGAPARQSFHRLGLHRGRGVLKEIGCGIAGYLACLPLLALGVLVYMMLAAIVEAFQTARGGQPTGPPSNRVVEMVEGLAGTPMIVLLVALMTIWAPLVEETIFRGALYRHLRGRLGVGLSVLIAALAFGLMHPYALVMLPPVIFLGAGLALIREWRGSLIAPITVHFIQNAGATVLILLALRFAGP